MLHRHSVSSYSCASIVTSCGMWNNNRIIKVGNERAFWECMCVWGSKCLSCIGWSHCTLDVGDELLPNRTLRLHFNEYIRFHTSIINESFIKSLYQAIIWISEGGWRIGSSGSISLRDLVYDAIRYTWPQQTLEHNMRQTVKHQKSISKRTTYL